MDEDNDQCEIELPIFIELKQSSFASNDLGTFCTMQLSADQFIGSYKGKARKSMSQCPDPEYTWAVIIFKPVLFNHSLVAIVFQFYYLRFLAQGRYLCFILMPRIPRIAIGFVSYAPRLTRPNTMSFACNKTRKLITLRIE